MGYVREDGKKAKVYNLNKITFGDVELRIYSWIKLPVYD
jgi:hypothetical protein